MPRDDSKRLTGRVQVRSDVSNPGLTQVARDPGMPRPPGGVRQSTWDADSVAMVKGLDALASGLTRMAQKANRKQEQEDRMAGQAARLSASQDDLTNIDAMVAVQNDNWRKGFMYTHGKAAGSDRITAMEAEYAANKEAFVSPAQFNKWLTGKLGEDTKGLEGEALEGYLESISQAERRLRGMHAQDSYLATRQKSMDDFSVAYRAEMDEALRVGASLREIHEITRKYHDLAGVMELNRDEVNELTFTYLKEGASIHERGDIFGAGTEGLGLFEFSSIDVDDPEHTIPGLANSPKWNARLASTRDELLRAQVQEQAEASELAKFQAEKEVRTLLSNDEFDKVEYMLPELVDSGVMSPSKANTFQQKVLDQRSFVRAVGNAALALTQGPAAIVNGKTEGEYDTEHLEVAQKAGIDKLMKEAGNDPLRQRNALERAITYQRHSGITDPRFASLLAASPEDPEAFMQSMLSYRQFKEVDPNWTAKQFAGNHAQRDRLMLADTLIEMGEDPATMIQRLAEVDTVEALNKMRNESGEVKYDLYRDIEAALEHDTKSPWFGTNSDAGDKGYVRETIREYTVALMAMAGGPGRMNAKTAAGLAMEKFKLTHRPIELPGEDNKTFWVYDGEGLLGADHEEAQRFNSDRLQELTKNTAYHDEKGYFAVPSPENPQAVQIYRVSDRWPAVTPEGEPLVLSRAEFYGKYEESLLPSKEEMAAEHAERQAARVEGAKSRKRKQAESRAENVKRKEQAAADREARQAARLASTRKGRRDEQRAENAVRTNQARDELFSRSSNNPKRRRARPNSKK